MLWSIFGLERPRSHFPHTGYLASFNAPPSWPPSPLVTKTPSLRRKRVPKGRLHRLDPRRMRASGSYGKPKSERTAGQSTSAHRDVVQETSSVDQETEESGRAVESTPELSDGEDTDSDIAPEEPSQTLLERRKKEIEDNVMAIVMKWLDEKFPPKRHCHSGNSSVRSHGASASGGCSAKTTGGGDNDKENEGPRRPGKRQQRDETPGRNGDGDGERGGKANKRAKKGETEKRFACPFYKHDPSKYKNERTCRFPGFETIARLKEHIYRNHRDKHVCPRCAEKFQSDQALQTHLRAVDLCEIKDFTFLDGIDSEQYEKIRARPKRGNSTPDEQWFSIYKIIFPDVGEDVLPRSPYCGDDGSPLRDMHDFIRRGLPPVMRRQVKEEVDRLTHGHEKQLTTTIMRIIPDVLARMIESYERQKEQADNETLGPVTSDIGVANEPQLPEPVHMPVDGLAPFDSQLNFDDLINGSFGEDVLDAINAEGGGGLGMSPWH